MDTFEIATGAIDGVNTLFSTSKDYVVGSVRVFTSGRLWETVTTELGNKQVQLQEAPLEDDLVVIYYRAL